MMLCEGAFLRDARSGGYSAAIAPVAAWGYIGAYANGAFKITAAPIYAIPALGRASKLILDHQP